MSQSVLHAPLPLAGLSVAQLARPVVAAFTRLVAFRRQVATQALLREMTARELADMGIDRSALHPGQPPVEVDRLMMIRLMGPR